MSSNSTDGGYPGPIKKLFTCQGINDNDGYKYKYCFAVKMLVISSAILASLLIY